MDYQAITIDTSVFDRYQCKLKVGILETLSQFKGAPVKLVLSDIVVGEVKKHIARNVESATASAKGSIKKFEDIGLVDREESAEFKKFIGSIKPQEIANKSIEDYIDLTGAEIINSDEFTKLSEVMRKYFESSPPFSSSGKKKNEFPDAIALLSIENWAKKNDLKLLAVSSDKDWIDFAEKCDFIDCYEDLVKGLSKVQPINDAYEFCQALEGVVFDHGGDALTNEILSLSLIEITSGLALYPEASSQFHYEFDYVDLEIVSIDFARNEEFIPVKAAENVLVFEAQLDVSSIAHCSFNFYVHDSIDKDYVPMGDNQSEIDFDFKAVVLVELTGNFSSSAESQVKIDKVSIISKPSTVSFGNIEPDWS